VESRPNIVEDFQEETVHFVKPGRFGRAILGRAILLAAGKLQRRALLLRGPSRSAIDSALESR